VVPTVTALLLLGCAAAWHPPGGRLDLDVPAGWTVTRNRRWFGEDYLTLADPKAHASITLDLVRPDRGTEPLPLDLLAETRVLAEGRAFGVETARSRLDHVVLDGHEAWAITGRRRWHFVTADYSAIVARVGRRLAVLTLQAPAGHLDDVAPAWGVVLDTLRFPEDPVAADAPLFAPDAD
jgi:hypothetical protein